MPLAEETLQEIFQSSFQAAVASTGEGVSINRLAATSPNQPEIAARPISRIDARAPLCQLEEVAAGASRAAAFFGSGYEGLWRSRSPKD